MIAAPDDEKATAFMAVTGADAETAKRMLDASNGDVDAAVALHFEAEGDASTAMSEDPPPSAAAAPPALPSEGAEDLVKGILSNARQEGDGPAGNPWEGLGSGNTLGGSADGAPAAASEDAADAAGAEPPVDRSNAKKVRVIFWADGFTVEDVTAEEAEAAKAAKAPPAPRRTGIGTIRDNAPPGPGQMPMPKVPELRKYEDEQEFMSDLKQSIPPKEFRELDLSTGTPRPRPVDIMLGDMRPQPYPADQLKRMMAMQQGASAAQPAAKSSFAAFSGSGQTLGGGSSSSDSAAAGAEGASAATAAGDAAGAGWSERMAPTVDEAAPTTEVQVRLATGGPQRFKLNKTHTVGDLKALVEAALAAAGAAPKPYVLAAGFPPKPLSDESATIEAAGLVGAAVNQRWA